ncbi:hypothetical protein B0H13DRAFT_2130547 [Mycena leptocephala]|nr:hypothetical protein B0H13DRAFT_2130547 [Mycena leptocephala]
MVLQNWQPRRRYWLLLLSLATTPHCCGGGRARGRGRVLMQERGGERIPSRKSCESPGSEPVQVLVPCACAS